MGRLKASPQPTRSRCSGQGGIHAEDFRLGFGEELAGVLDVATWHEGLDLGAEYQRMQAEIEQAVSRENAVARQIRERVFPLLGHPVAVSVAEIIAAQRELLFPGHVEAADGISDVYRTLALTIHQVGVALVSYRGTQGAWQQRLFHRELAEDHGDPVQGLVDLLHRPGDAETVMGAAANLSELAQRGICSFGERAVLFHAGSARWRMGHGSPAPLELLLAGGCTDVVIESIRLLRMFIEEHRRFVFVASDLPPRPLVTVGQGLRPLEYLVVSNLAEQLQRSLARWREQAPASVDLEWDGKRLTPVKWMKRFRDEVASQVAVGVYRAGLLSPPRGFYGHRDEVGLAARIALADGCLQERTGIPLLLELAGQTCQSVYGGGTLARLAESAYTGYRLPGLGGSD